MIELSSRKSISKLTGRLAQSSISRYFIPKFIKTYRIAEVDAEKPWQEYGSLNDFFTRRLKPGVRTVSSAIDALVSPVDAKITAHGKITRGEHFVIKDQTYTLEELFNHSPHLLLYQEAYYWVLYLSPSDYHRIHVPVTGELSGTEHISGTVYPVNDVGLKHIKRVLSRNERLLTYVRHEAGEVAVIKVGAMNVSSIHYAQKPLPLKLERGDELAYFQFGSTVVLLTESGTCTPRKDLLVGDSVKMGEVLGHLHHHKSDD